MSRQAPRAQRLSRRSPRSPGDWSIEDPIRCECELCERLTRFLRAPDQLGLEWPLANDGRRHIHGQIDLHRLPVSQV